MTERRNLLSCKGTDALDIFWSYSDVLVKYGEHDLVKRAADEAESRDPGGATMDFVQGSMFYDRQNEFEWKPRKRPSSHDGRRQEAPFPGLSVDRHILGLRPRK